MSDRDVGGRVRLSRVERRMIRASAGELLNVTEAADVFGIHTGALRGILRGLPHYQNGRIKLYWREQIRSVLMNRTEDA